MGFDLFRRPLSYSLPKDCIHMGNDLCQYTTMCQNCVAHPKLTNSSISASVSTSGPDYSIENLLEAKGKFSAFSPPPAFKVMVSPDVPKFVLSEDVPVTKEFRDDFNRWALDFFGTTNIVPDGEVYKIDSVFYMNPRTHARMKCPLTS